MARAPADPSARLAILRAARDLLAPGETLNLTELATALGYTDRHLRGELAQHPEWPVLSRGSEGVDYVFDAHAIIDAMIRHWEGKRVERAEKAARLAKLAGIVAPIEAVQRLSLTELREVERLQRDAQRRKIEQREYVPRTEHEAIVAEILTVVQTELLASHAVLDPAGTWPATVRADVVDYHKTLLVTMHDKLKDRLTDGGPPRRSGGRARSARR